MADGYKNYVYGEQFYINNYFFLNREQFCFLIYIYKTYCKINMYFFICRYVDMSVTSSLSSKYTLEILSNQEYILNTSALHV